MLNLTLLDICAPALAIGYAVGRIGCQLSGDGDYGIPWDGPWAMAYPDGTVPTDVAVHPTPIYETLAMGLVAYVLWRLRFSLPARPPVRALPGPRRRRAVPGRVHPPQRRGRARAHPGAADQRRDDRRRWRVADRQAQPWRAASRPGVDAGDDCRPRKTYPTHENTNKQNGKNHLGPAKRYSSLAGSSRSIRESR